MKPYSYYKISYMKEGKLKTRDYYCSDDYRYGMCEKLACIVIIRKYEQIHASRASEIEDELLHQKDTFVRGKRISDVNFTKVGFIREKDFTRWNMYNATPKKKYRETTKHINQIFFQ